MYADSSVNISKASLYRGDADTTKSETIYTYDTWGNLFTVSHDGKTVCEYTYDGLGQTLSMKEYKEPGESAYILRTYAYDSLGRCTSIKYLDNGSEDSVLESFVYTYDKNSQILTCRHTNNLPAEDKRMDETRSYTYDSYGQLTESTITDHKNNDAETVTTYTYDKVGNRTAMSKDGQVTEYTYNGLNQLTEAETEDAIIKYTYDGRGNQTEEYNETEGITTSHTYAVTGEMTGLTVTSGDTTTLTQENQYNHEGIRISKTEGGVTRRYYYDNGTLVCTKDGATVSSANVLSGDGDILGSYRGEVYHVYTKDIQNSAESIIKEDGTLAAAYSYSDFGETEETTESSFDNEICYTGAVYDVQSGLYYMNARYYNPANGRFISQDTYRGELDDANQWHLYAYCANNPINYVDPSGHAYNSNAAVTYAKKWAKGRNPQYRNCILGGDCTNFVSQCLVAGGMKQNPPKDYKKKGDTYGTTKFWYSKRHTEIVGNYDRPVWYVSTSWINVGDFYKYWKGRCISFSGTKGFSNKHECNYKTVQEKAKKGDIVQLKVGNVWSHSIIITGGSKGNYKYCCHSTDKKNEPLKNLTAKKKNVTKYRIIRPK